MLPNASIVQGNPIPMVNLVEQWHLEKGVVKGGVKSAEEKGDELF